MNRAAAALCALAALAGAQQAPAPAGEGGSLLTRPLWPGEEPPECRALRAIRLELGAQRSEPDARELALELARSLRAGADFAELAARHSSGPEAAEGGVLGTFPPGVLAPELDAFLFSAEVGALSGPLTSGAAVFLLERLERYAGCRLIRVASSGEEAREEAADILARLHRGEDFAALARERSADAESAARGGDYRIFERGSSDRLVKGAIFRAAVGEIVGPVETPLGLHVLQRVPPEALDPALCESGWVRARALLVSHREAPGPRELSARTPAEGLELTLELARRLEEGASLAELAARYDDDPGGRERAGDLGWLRRRNPGMQAVLERVFLLEPGGRTGPLELPVGWLFLERVR